MILALRSATVSRIAELMEREEAALRSLVSTKRCTICTATSTWLVGRSSARKRFLEL